MSSNRNGSHKSRSQSTRDAQSVHEEMPILFEETGPLPDIPARPGYVQRWIRVQRGREADSRNIYKAARKGWEPRKADTVPKSMQWLMVRHEGMGGVIGTHDLVLMERPVDLESRAAAHKKQQRDNLERAVKSNLFSEHRDLGGEATGYTAPEIQSTAQVERGRPMVADD